MFDSLWPHGLWPPPRLFCPWDSPGKNTAVGCHTLFQGIFPTQGSKPGLPHCRQILCCLSHLIFHSVWISESMCFKMENYQSKSPLKKKKRKEIFIRWPIPAKNSGLGSLNSLSRGSLGSFPIIICHPSGLWCDHFLKSYPVCMKTRAWQLVSHWNFILKTSKLAALLSIPPSSSS